MDRTKNERVYAATEKVVWPSGLRRWFKAPVISMAWVRIPPLPFMLHVLVAENAKIFGEIETT